MTPRSIYGMHDPGGEYLMADKPGWIVFTEAIGRDPFDTTGRDYSHWASAGYGVLVRLNHAHNGKDGTIPTPAHYDDFAQRCANFARNSRGVHAYIVGNEPNHQNERPNGDAIWPQMYADCFNRCHAAIHTAATNVRVLPAAIAPWDATTKYPGNEDGDWVTYFTDMLAAIPHCGGIVLHTYTHGAGIHLITSSARMDAPFQHRRYEFRAYRDFLEAVPTDKRTLPVYITETDQVQPWTNANTGWVDAAYGEINAWNQSNGTQKIHCLCLYRWSRDDQWAIVDKPGVHEDFLAAIGRGYTSPAMGQNTVSHTTHLPSVVSSGPTPAPDLPPYPADWDPRLTARGVKIQRVKPGAPGTLAWVVTKGRWLNEQESQGRHHFYADVYADNEPVVGAILAARWPGDGYATFEAEAKPAGEPMANFPMSKSLNEFSFQVNEPKHPSDVVTGVGMGADGNSGIHTSTYIEWTLYRTPQASTPPPTGPQPASTIGWVIAPDGVNLRTTPDGSIITAIPYADLVRITGVSDQEGWVRVRYGDQEGFAAMRYIGLHAPEPLPAPVEPTQPTGGKLDPLVLEAILQVESGGRGFGNDGRLLIRFEAHLFATKVNDYRKTGPFFRYDVDKPWVNQEWRRSPADPWRNIHTGSQADEYAAFEFAIGLNRTAAYQSISMGAPQVMGFNHARIGYPNAVAMFNAFQRSLPAQLIGFVNFILADGALLAAINARNWEALARGYNGAGNVAQAAAKYQAAYARLLEQSR